MNVIVMDDEKEAILVFTSHVIDVPNISLSVFSSDFEAALTYSRAHQVDCAFLDVVMPDINGIELAKLLIDINPSIKIVLITGYAQDVTEIKRELGKNFFGFCYKPYDATTIKEIIARLLSANKPDVVFKTFPRFDAYINEICMDFERSKAKELLALLVDHHGGEVTMEEAITKLWVDKNSELAKRLYRDAVSRLRMTLTEYGVSHIVRFSRGKAALNCADIKCDYWDYLNGDKSLFHGEYMRPYEWAGEIEDMLL